MLDARGLCPVGWHVPSESDWEDLVAHVSEQSAMGAEVEGWDGMAHWEVGQFLKDSCCWLPPRLLALDEFKPTNDHGFKAIPSGALFFWIFSRRRSIRIRKMVEFASRGKRVALPLRDLDGLSFARRPSHEDTGFCRAVCEGCGQVKQLSVGRLGDSVC